MRERWLGLVGVVFLVCSCGNGSAEVGCCPPTILHEQVYGTFPVYKFQAAWGQWWPDGEHVLLGVEWFTAADCGPWTWQEKFYKVPSTPDVATQIPSSGGAVRPLLYLILAKFTDLKRR